MILFLILIQYLNIWVITGRIAGNAAHSRHLQVLAFTCLYKYKNIIIIKFIDPEYHLKNSIPIMLNYRSLSTLILSQINVDLNMLCN